jgi:hypothetical protein
MVRFDIECVFSTPNRAESLLVLLEGRIRLVLYQFMNNGSDASWSSEMEEKHERQELHHLLYGGPEP